MAQDPWHFPRTDLSSRVLLSLTEGPSKALTLFAPRRKGKTEFLRKDLQPAAEERGHTVVYISFWDPLEPLALLVSALEKAVAQTTILGRAGAIAQRLTPKIRLSAKIPGTDASGEIDLTDIPKKAERGLVAHLDTLLGRLERADRTTILLLDEVQELARREGDSGLVGGLRTSLDVRDGLRTIFTGSSREGLREMFASSKAPFFHFSSQIDLPPLGEEFVDHLLGRMKTISRNEPDRDEALKVFADVGHSPFHFRRIVDGLILDPELGFEAALVRYREELASSQRYDQTWLGLTPLRRAVLQRLAERPEAIFSGESIEAISTTLGRKTAASSVRTALLWFEKQGILDKWDNEWRFADDEFRIWLQATVIDASRQITPSGG